MAVERITPRMAKALSSDVPPIFFADIWLSVLTDSIDDQTDFAASKSLNNIDYTTKPGFATLSYSTYELQQTQKNAQLAIYRASGPPYFTYYYAIQSFRFNINVYLRSVSVWISNPNSGPVTLRLVISNGQASLITIDKSISAFYDNEVTFQFEPVFIQANYTYYIYLYNFNTAPLYVRYQNTDVYADGQLDYVYWKANLGKGDFSYNLGDIYFRLNYDAYAVSGNLHTKRLDVGMTPSQSGVYQMSYSLPVGSGIKTTLFAYTSDTSGDPALTLEDVKDGAELPPYRFWEAFIELTSTPDHSQTPQIDMIEIIFPRDNILLREAVPLRHCSDAFRDYYPGLKPVSFKMSDIKVIERVSAGGEATSVLTDPTGDIIKRLVSDSPLKNYRAQIHIGADVPDFSPRDLLRFFIGTVQAAKYKPKYRNDAAELDLTFKNPILDLTRKVPMPAETGAVTLSDLAINYDGTHVMDAMLDLMRSKAQIPARYINVDSFISAKNNIGNTSLPAPTLIIRRSNIEGLPDTSIKSPEELRKHLSALTIIADGYITDDESSRIIFIPHDPSAVPEAQWADESYVKDGLDAIPIESISEIDLGYDSMLFNVVMLGCEWDGSGGDWNAFSKIFAYVHAASLDDFAPGRAVYMSMMDKSMAEASKWLGPENGYNGETIAQALAARYANRFAYPPVILRGVVVPLSMFLLTKGAVVQIWSKEFCKFKRRGIALSETLKFMIISKKLDRNKNKMIFDLMELT